MSRFDAVCWAHHLRSGLTAPLPLRRGIPASFPEILLMVMANRHEAIPDCATWCGGVRLRGGTRVLVGGKRGGHRGGHIALCRRLVHAELGEHARAVFEFQQREQDVLGPDVVVAHPQGLPEGEFQCVPRCASNGTSSGSSSTAGGSFAVTACRTTWSSAGASGHDWGSRRSAHLHDLAAAGHSASVNANGSPAATTGGPSAKVHMRLGGVAEVPAAAERLPQPYVLAEPDGHRPGCRQARTAYAPSPGSRTTWLPSSPDAGTATARGTRYELRGTEQRA